MDREYLRKTLQNIENDISLYDLAKLIKTDQDEILIYIQNEVLPEYTQLFKKNAFKMPFWSKEETEQFFLNPIVDLGFLCQHKIKEIKQNLEKQHKRFGNQLFYDRWILFRGY